MPTEIIIDVSLNAFANEKLLSGNNNYTELLRNEVMLDYYFKGSPALNEPPYTRPAWPALTLGRVP